jgi:hypothetical protein
MKKNATILLSMAMASMSKEIFRNDYSYYQNSNSFDINQINKIKKKNRKKNKSRKK